MAKNNKWKLEYSIFIFVVLGFLMMLFPVSFENTRQAKNISKWNEIYNRVEYMFKVIDAQVQGDLLTSLSNSKTPEETEKYLLSLVKPYIRIKTEGVPSKHYKPKYLNGSKPIKGQMYYFDDFYFAEKNSIIGIKDIISDKSTDAIFIMMFDVNGILPPNRWGKDIFGINIFSEGRIEPFGYELSMTDLKTNCSDKETGVACSYFYKIGGGFED
ncbi:MAG: hypothetical protein R3Y28_08915 [Candidatus Gastranaerophilales bacterium]